MHYPFQQWTCTGYSKRSRLFFSTREVHVKRFTERSVFSMFLRRSSPLVLFGEERSSDLTEIEMCHMLILWMMLINYFTRAASIFVAVLFNSSWSGILIFPFKTSNYLPATFVFSFPNIFPFLLGSVADAREKSTCYFGQIDRSLSEWLLDSGSQLCHLGSSERTTSYK